MKSCALAHELIVCECNVEQVGFWHKCRRIWWPFKTCSKLCLQANNAISHCDMWRRFFSPISMKDHHLNLSYLKGLSSRVHRHNVYWHYVLYNICKLIEFCVLNFSYFPWLHNIWKEQDGYCKCCKQFWRFLLSFFLHSTSSSEILVDRFAGIIQILSIVSDFLQMAASLSV